MKSKVQKTQHHGRFARRLYTTVAGMSSGLMERGTSGHACMVPQGSQPLLNSGQSRPNEKQMNPATIGLRVGLRRSADAHVALRPSPPPTRGQCRTATTRYAAKKGDRRCDRAKEFKPALPKKRGNQSKASEASASSLSAQSPTAQPTLPPARFGDHSSHAFQFLPPYWPSSRLRGTPYQPTSVQR